MSETREIKAAGKPTAKAADKVPDKGADKVPEKVADKVVDIFTDGACSGNPGPGGWGVILRYGETERELYGGEAGTTNNRMELLAAIRGLESLIRPVPVRLWTDSQYVQKGISEWMAGWKRKGWKTAGGQPVKNQDLWQRLDQLTREHKVEFRWVRGHAGHPENERADALARRGIADMKAGTPS